jgi:hypothetical protein
MFAKYEAPKSECKSKVFYFNYELIIVKILQFYEFSIFPKING